MGNELTIFNNEEFGRVRVLEDNNGKVWFVARDVAEVLGYTKLDSMYRRLSQQQMMDINPQSLENTGFPHIDGNQLEPNPNIKRMKLITEGGLYKSILGSQIPTAERFQDWVTDEVLPSIRKHGMYATEELLDNPDLLIAAATKLKEERAARIEAERKRTEAEERERKIAEEKNKIENKLEHKTEVLDGLLDDITLMEKRRRITDIIRKGEKDKIPNRYNLLYREFEAKMHIDINRRMIRDKKLGVINKSMNNKMEYICQELNMLDELYELCCKLFEGDFNSILEEIKNNNNN